MLTILRAQLLKLKRAPGTFGLMILMTVLFTFAIGSQADHQVTVYTYYDDTDVTVAEAEQWITQLNASESFKFILTDEEKAINRVMDRRADYALELQINDFQIVAAVNDSNVRVLQQYVRSVFERELMIDAAAGNDDEGFREQLSERLQDPILTIEASTINAEQDFVYDARVQSLFGFTLFFLIYTISFSINAVLEEKNTGVWDRVILSPVSKVAMYSGHLVYSFLVGMLQSIVVFTLFRYAFKFPLGDHYMTMVALTAVYIFAIVALGMMLVGLVQTPQQMNVLIPIVGVSFAMLGGAYWPIEIVTNPVLIALSKIVPVTYGMEALKGVVYYGHGWAELIQPVSIMVLFGVICMGIGINLIERRGK